MERLRTLGGTVEKTRKRKKVGHIGRVVVVERTVHAGNGTRVWTGPEIEPAATETGTGTGTETETETARGKEKGEELRPIASGLRQGVGAAEAKMRTRTEKTTLRSGGKRWKALQRVREVVRNLTPIWGMKTRTQSMRTEKVSLDGGDSRVTRRKRRTLPGHNSNCKATSGHE